MTALPGLVPMIVCFLTSLTVIGALNGRQIAHGQIRMEAGRVELKRGRVDLQQAVRSVATALRRN